MSKLKPRKRITACIQAFLRPDIIAKAESPQLSTFKRIIFRRAERLISPEVTVTSAAVTDDRDLVQRIIRAYGLAQEAQADTGSLWSNHFGGIKAPIHEALMRGDIGEVTSILRNPVTNNLFFGFDDPTLAYADPEAQAASAAERDAIRYWCREGYYDLLVRLAEALGAIPLDYPPETADKHPPLLSVEDIVARIEQQTGPLLFPNPYPSERGIVSTKGVIAFRAISAVYQAYRLADLLSGLAQKSVVEIGPGLGRTAYFAGLFGCNTYTLVDIPMSGVAQAYFLGRTHGPSRIRLFGESHAADFELIPPDPFLAGREEFDFAINVDSLTEMSKPIAETYLSNISQRTPALLSINHEYNAFSVRDLYRANPSWRVHRYPYWMRQGYAEEVIHFN